MKALNPTISGYTPHTFGWGSQDHQAIARGGYRLMPDGEIKQWLENNVRLTQWYDNAQDTYLSGSQHFVNLENPENSTQPGIFSHHAVQSWSVLNHLLTPFNASRQQQQWSIQPLTENQLPSGPTVYDSVVEKYNQAVGTMIKYQLADSALTPLQKEKHSKDLAKHVGALNHYVADLYMPLHASRWFNWPIAPDRDGKRDPELMQGLHQLIEQEMFNRGDLLRLMQQSPQQTRLVQLQREQLKPFLLKQVENSHLLVYKLFQTNKQFWEDNPDLRQDPEAYKSGLSQVIKPIIQKRIVEAQQALGSVLHLAWQDASRFVEQYHAMAQKYSGLSTSTNPFAQINQTLEQGTNHRAKQPVSI